MKKKIGILTMYHKSMNYGGLLQAYALCRVMADLGYEAEQIKIHRIFHSIPRKRSLKDYFVITNYYNKFRYLIEPYKKSFYEKKIGTNCNIREKTCTDFREIIPHSELVYTDDTISDCVDLYDAFVAGSDQVWGITQETSPYLMGFVPENKSKFSYAASMGYSKITEEMENIYRRIFRTYQAISVREDDAVTMLQPLTSLTVEKCLDPTLLLDKSDWSEILVECEMDKPYLLCYYLGNDKRIRKLAQKYAKKHNLAIVTFPHFPDSYHSHDIGFGDVQIYDAGPEKFISYIHGAECVFTDSFHASVFSLIFEKQFFVFNRKGEERMISRIYSLMDLFESGEHFCDEPDKFSLEYIENTKKIDYTKERKLYQNMKEKSLGFLRRNLDNIGD